MSNPALALPVRTMLQHASVEKSFQIVMLGHLGDLAVFLAKAQPLEFLPHSNPPHTLGSHPCVALSSAQVLPEWINPNLAGNSFTANSDNPLNFVSHSRAPLHSFSPAPSPGVAGLAGMSKEREMPPAQRTAVIREFDLKKGILVATFSGVMSACFSYALAAGDPIRAITLRNGTSTLWQGLPILVIALLGGFTTNFIWCLILNVRNRTGYQYFQSNPAPMLANYLFCALAGITWYFQFFFYTMGETQMGRYKFSSWTLHMASIIIFSSLWGIGLHEWKGASRRTKGLLTLSLAVLVASTVIVGYGNYLGTEPKTIGHTPGSRP